MLEASPLLENESKETSSLSSHNASRSSTPSISHFDGTPLFLLPHAHDLDHLDALSPSQDMAIHPVPPHADVDTDFEPEVKAPSQTRIPFDKLSRPPESDHLDLQPQTISQEPVSRSAPSLHDLAHLLRLEKYQSRRGRQVRSQLYHAHLATSRTSRLLSIARSTQQTLAECIRSEDKQSFANLYSTFHDAVAACLETIHEGLEQSWNEGHDRMGYPGSFVDSLPSAQRSSLLHFIARIRGEPAFIADRLSSLNQKELLALLPDRNGPKSSDSVFESSVRSASRASRHLGYVVDSQTDLLTTLEPNSPLEALIHSTRTLDRELRHDTAARDIWATACGRLIADQKRGSEKLVPAVIDTWAASSPWPGKRRLDIWIGQTLENGAFILDHASRQSFRVRVQGRQDPHTDEEGKADAFYAKAVQSLLELLADDNGASVIPDGAITLCRTVCSKIGHSSRQRDGFCNFVLIRWLFHSFILNAITLPETHDMATERFISDNARQRILREVAYRAQKVVADVLYAWKHISPISTDLANTVRAIAGRFKDVSDTGLPLKDGSEEFEERFLPSHAARGLLGVSQSDVIVLIDALYPRHRPASIASDLDMANSGLRSSASSASGFSLFPTPNSSETILFSSTSWHPDAYRSTSASGVDSTLAVSGNTGSMDADLSSQVEASQLRDVYASVEEFVVSSRFSPDRQVAIIRMENQDSAVTQSMRLRETAASVSKEKREIPDASDGISCSDLEFCMQALEELLLESEGTEPSIVAQDTSAEVWLLQGLQDRVRRSRENGQFVQAHTFLEKLVRCEQVLSTVDSYSIVQTILLGLKREAEVSIERTLASAEECETQLKVVQPALSAKRNELQDYVRRCDLLRDKMLYTADVRTTAAYDEVKSIASALKVMGKTKKAAKSRTAPPLRHWTGPKISSTNLHLKTEAQIIEILSASSNHGGPNKLSDDQSKALAAWLASNAVQNICIGEERLQKLCMEIRKAVDNLTADSSPLWSSSLFTLDRPHPVVGQPYIASNAFWTPPLSTRLDMLRLHTNVSSSRDAVSSSASSHPLSARSSRDYLETRSPTLASKSSAQFRSPAMTEATSPSPATSVGSSYVHALSRKAAAKVVASSKSKQEVLSDVRKHITSLLLSELAATMFSAGSETDQAFWKGLGGELAEKHLNTLRRRSEDREQRPGVGTQRFDFRGAFETLIDQFSAACGPAAKLEVLLEVDTLLGLNKPIKTHRSATDGSAANATLDTDPSVREASLPISDTKVLGFRQLFCNTRTRPTTVFRDLQYIAALLPSIVSEYSARGLAFWHACLAITGLKKEICTVMVETADSIIAYVANNRGHGRTPSTAQQQRDSATFSTTGQTPPAEDIAKYSMADAAHLLQITAKEGDAVAQRELATLYLTHPELMEPIIAPLARPREVFKEELESKWRKNQDPTRCDPATMCVAHHWMSLSAKGGDALAREYLKQREEMERLP